MGVHVHVCMYMCVRLTTVRLAGGSLCVWGCVCVCVCVHSGTS